MLINGLLMALQGIISGLGALLGVILGILPDSPFSLIDNSPLKPYLDYINFFIPIGFMLDVFAVFLGGLAVYYIYQAVLRWIKAVGD